MGDRDENLVKTLVVPQQGGDFGFDFGAFERSEAEAALQQPKKPEPTVPMERPAEKRTVIARNWLPPGDAVVETRPVGNMTVVSLRGRINESFRGAELGQSLHGIVVFDLSQVDRISSFGVKGWLQMLEGARFTHCYFYRCSEAVINQITMMRNFCGVGRIHSLLVPYMCTGCGEEFNVVYDAVADREAILGRSPIPVECPRCAAVATIADDPWGYLAVDDHLLDDVPADLEQVLEHLNQAQRVDPIEKFVSEDETRIRINVPLDARLRLGRALTGLEGRVAFDLTPRPELPPTGVQRLLEAIRDLDPEVSEVWVDGATRGLIDAMLLDPPPRTFVSTAWVTAVSPDSGIRRPVLVDLRKKRQALLRGEMPAVDAGWARGTLRFEDAEAVFAAARHLLPYSATPSPTATPVPHHQMMMMPAPVVYSGYQTSGTHPGMQHQMMQSMGSHPGMQPQMASMGSHPGTHPGMQGLHPSRTSPGFPVQQPYPQQQQTRTGAYLRSPLFVWQLAAFLAVTLLFASLAFTAVFYVAYTWFKYDDGTSVVAERPEPLAIPKGGEGWDGTSALPPAWVEQPVVVGADGVRGTGVGHGATPEAAADQSRLVAIYHLTQYIAQQLDGTAVGNARGQDPGEDEAEAVANRLIADVGAWASPARVNQAVKTEGDGFVVATQHQLDPDTLRRILDYYRATAEFRGLTVGRTFPFRATEARVVVVKAESWFRGAHAGDAVVELGRNPIGSIEDFLRQTEAMWKDTPEGGKMILYVESDGKRSPVEFVRGGQGRRPEPKIELLPLELPK